MGKQNTRDFKKHTTEKDVSFWKVPLLETLTRRQIKSTESPDFFHRRRAPAEIGRRPRENMARTHDRTSDSLASQSEVARRDRQMHLPKAKA